MSDFPSAVKYINLRPARVITQQEADAAPVPLSKYQRLLKTRAIQKLNYRIVLPGFAFDMQPYGKFHGRLAFQYNISFVEPFFLLDFKPDTPILDVNGIANGCVTLKWRNGSSVSRYMIAGRQRNELISRNVTNFPPYANQLIPANFVLEYWLVQSMNGNPYFIQLPNLVLVTSKLVDPPTASDTSFDQNLGLPLGIPDLGVNQPENLPYNQDNIVWLDN